MTMLVCSYKRLTIIKSNIGFIKAHLSFFVVVYTVAKSKYGYAYILVLSPLSVLCL